MSDNRNLFQRKNTKEKQEQNPHSHDSVELSHASEISYEEEEENLQDISDSSRSAAGCNDGPGVKKKFSGKGIKEEAKDMDCSDDDDFDSYDDSYDEESYDDSASYSDEVSKKKKCRKSTKQDIKKEGNNKDISGPYKRKCKKIIQGLVKDEPNNNDDEESISEDQMEMIDTAAQNQKQQVLVLPNLQNETGKPSVNLTDHFEPFFTKLQNLPLTMLNPPNYISNNFENYQKATNTMIKALELSTALQALIYKSQIACNSKDIMTSMIKEGDITKILNIINQKANGSADILEGQANQCALSLFNCSRHPLFLEAYHQTLPNQLYDQLKRRTSIKLLNQDLPLDAVEDIAFTISNLIVVGKESSLLQFQDMVMQDLKAALEIGDFQFVTEVADKIIKAEDLQAITINKINKKTKKVVPFYSQIEADRNSEDKQLYGSGEQFIQSSLLSEIELAMLSQKFREQVTEKLGKSQFDKLTSSKWNLIFEEQNHKVATISSLQILIDASQKCSNMIMLFKGTCQDKQILVGGFSKNGFKKAPCYGSKSNCFDIASHQADFLWYYTDDKQYHFIYRHQDKFMKYATVDFFDGDNSLLLCDGFLDIIWTYSNYAMLGYLSHLKCLEDPKFKSPSANFDIEKIEIWSSTVSDDMTLKSDQEIRNELIELELYDPFSPFIYFRENVVFQVSKDMTLGELKKEIVNSVVNKGAQVNFIKHDEQELCLSDESSIRDLMTTMQSSDQILDLFITTDQTSTDIALMQSNIQAETFKERKPMFKRFKTKEGFIEILNFAKDALNHYTNENIRQQWSDAINEIHIFIQLDVIFEKLIEDNTILMSLLDVINEKCDKKAIPPKPAANLKQQDSLAYDQQSFVDYSYDSMQDLQPPIQNNPYFPLPKAVDIKLDSKKKSECMNLTIKVYEILNKLFQENKEIQIREMVTQNGIIEICLNKIGKLEQIYVAPQQNFDEGIVDTLLPLKQLDDKIFKKQSAMLSRISWSIGQYVEKKENNSALISIIISIIKNYMAVTPFSKMFINQMLASTLIQAIEVAFNGISFIELVNQYEVIMAYLELICEIMNHQELKDLLFQSNEASKIFQLQRHIVSLNSNCQMFLECLNRSSQQDENEQTKQTKALALKIQETSEILKPQGETITTQSGERALKFQEILNLPVAEAYLQLLQKQRFGYMSMKNQVGLYQHQFSIELKVAQNPPVTKLVRLAQEIADLSNSLPCEHTNAIFCKVDKERIDAMKVLIMGASGTPYANGAFIYDIYLDNNYPTNPPKCQLITTGGGQVRFNPNLYNCGKVCLSLLGTWRGNSSENWDPKLSTILQVLLSLQAIVMNNEVYFNEPGYENIKTDDANRRNEGYSNIVKYCTIKFAIIDAIKNPPKGFEAIVRASFYLKKEQVLKEVQEWVTASSTSNAFYDDLVSMHNSSWASKFSPKGSFQRHMTEIYKELEAALATLEPPTDGMFEQSCTEECFSVQQNHQVQADLMQADSILSPTYFQQWNDKDIEMAFEGMINPPTTQLKMDIKDDKVKDRWSRYIGAMGIEAVAKQAESRVLIAGLDALGVEIAKNVVLAGCKELLLYDHTRPQIYQLSGQFFLSENDFDSVNQKSRAQISKDKLQALNSYVKLINVETISGLDNYIEKEENLNVVVLTGGLKMAEQQISQINNICRNKNIKFIYTTQNGLFGMLFNDFGKEHIVVDPDGEELQQVMIKDISYDEEQKETVVTILPGTKHKFQDGESITLSEVVGMQSLKDVLAQQQIPSINDMKDIQIKVIDQQRFALANVDARQFTKYEGNGIARQKKVPKVMKFKTIFDCYLYDSKANAYIDQNLLISDFEKINNKQIIHYLYQAYYKYLKSHIFSDNTTQENFLEFLQIIIQHVLPKEMFNLKEQVQRLAEIFFITKDVAFPPLSAFFGGIAAQEVIKAITQKFMPINQFLYHDCLELFPEKDINLSEWLTKAQSLKAKNDRYAGLSLCLGEQLLNRIHDCRLFLIGAGAIGCELMKNYAMLGLGTGEKGKITVTDPDVIEVSNLNRQFLFREKHLRLPKSTTAAAAIIQMNPQLKSHISAKLDKVHDGTQHIYNEEFFKEQTIVTNALDNVQARLYIDNKCLQARTPLIDSGTLGPKGHVQIILPQYKTESYASQKDPDDNQGEIPQCTLKMFPEEPMHCVEWAKDLFGKLFTLKPQGFNKWFLNDYPPQISSAEDMALFKKIHKMEQKRPKCFEECIAIARKKFQKYFYNDIMQLLHVYPLNKTTEEGRPFWSLPKRPPTSIEYDPTNAIHAQFITSYACLLAKMNNIELPQGQPRSEENRQKVAFDACLVKVDEFIPSDKKASAIKEQVDKTNAQGVEEEEKKKNSNDDVIMIDTTLNQGADNYSHINWSDMTEVQKVLQDLFEQLKQNWVNPTLQVQEFEKDNDDNFQIDFIHAMAAIRSQNYRMEPMDWITVKIKAGKIVPALATTTAAIAGLQTIELIKALKGCPLNQHRNTFLNLAVPVMMESEPALASKKVIGEVKTEVTIWDRWEYNAVSRDVTLFEVVEHIETTYQLKVQDIFYRALPLHLNALQPDRNKSLSESTLLSKVKNVLQNIDSIRYIDLTMTLAGSDIGLPSNVLDGIPTVRVNFPDNNAKNE